MTIVLLPDLALPIWEFSSYQPPSGYLSITWSASGGSARDLRRQQAQGVPSSPKSCLPSATGLGTFGLCPKAAGTFRGPLPPFLRAASPYSSFRAKKQALCRPERCAAPVQPCLSPSGLPPSGGETVPVFPDLKYSAPAPCRSGSKGEAPWSPKAKSRIPYFRMPQPNSSGFLARPMPPIHSIQRMRPLPSFSLTRKEKRKRVPVLSGMPSFASGSDTS